MNSKALSHSLVKHHLLFSVISLIVLVVALFGIPRMVFVSDFSTFRSVDNSQQLQIDANNENYTNTQKLIFVVNPSNDVVFNWPNLQLIENLTHKLWQLPYVSRVSSLSNHQRTRVEGDDFSVADLFDSLEVLSEGQIEEIKEYALDQPELVNRLVSKDAKVMAFDISIHIPIDDATNGMTGMSNSPDSGMADAINAIRELRNETLQSHPGMSIYLLGEPLLEQALLEVAIRDATTLFPLINLFCVVALIVLLRSTAVVVGAFSLITVSVLMSLGLAGWFGFNLDPISAASPNMVLMLAMADGIHLLTHYIVYLRQGDSRPVAMEKSLAINIKPIFLTSITTSIGFLGMNFADSPAFRDFGNMAAIGVMVAFILTLTLLPALVLRIPMKKPPTEPLKLIGIMRVIGDVAVSKSKLWLWGTAVLVGIAITFIGDNRLNDNIVDYFDESTDIRAATDFASKNLSGFQSFQFSLDSKEVNGINDVAFLAKSKQFAEWLRMQPEVSQVYSYTDILERINQSMHNDDPSWHRLPESNELASQYLLLYQMSLSYGHDLSNLLTFDKSAFLMTVMLKKLKNDELIDIESRAKSWLIKNAPELVTPAASRSVLFAHLGQDIIESMMVGSVIAILLMSLTLCVGLGSVRYGLISLIPNALPAIIVYGFWGLFVGEINMAVAVSFTISLGIVVDDTVHFLSKYLDARKRGDDPEHAIKYSINVAGTALFTTTCVIVGSMIILGQSNFGMNSSIAMMMVPILVTALALDFLFLPALLLRFDKAK